MLELFAGAGGLSLGLERAGFLPVALVEVDRDSAATLRKNRPAWPVAETDLRDFDASSFVGVDLVAADIPSSPFSEAGKGTGNGPEDYLPDILRVIEQVQPAAVLVTSVRGLAAPRHREKFLKFIEALQTLGFRVDWTILRAAEFGVPQDRPRLALVGLRPDGFTLFDWPRPLVSRTTVGESLGSLMASHGWSGAKRWSSLAGSVAPTIVGGSKTHGGADLGPTRAKQAWLLLGVDPRSIAEDPPSQEAPTTMMPRLTNRMVAALQGFGGDWEFVGRKTSVFRQIASATPPAVGEAIGRSLLEAFETKGQ